MLEISCQKSRPIRSLDLKYVKRGEKMNGEGREYCPVNELNYQLINKF